MARYTINVDSLYYTVGGKIYIDIPQPKIVVTITGETYNIPDTFGFSFDFDPDPYIQTNPIKFRPRTYDRITFTNSDNFRIQNWWSPVVDTTLYKNTNLSFILNDHTPTNRIFNSSNRTSRTFVFPITHVGVEFESEVFAGGELPNNALTIEYILDAPPTYNVTPTSFSAYYKNITEYSAIISDALAQYGGYIVRTELTIGSQKAIGKGNGKLTIVPNQVGTFTPKVVVIDSRGQTTTKFLDSITVKSNASQIKQESGGIISPQINVNNVLFNPYGTNLSKNTVDKIINVSPSVDMVNVQTNVSDETRHIITHASNVVISNTQTLQDWITEQYNNLT